MRKFYITIFCLLAICRVIHAQGSGGSEDKNTFAYNNVVYKVDPDGAASPTQIQADDVSNIYGETHFFSKKFQVLDGLYDQDKVIFAGYDDQVPTLRLSTAQFNSKITLDWDAVAGAASYFIFREGETDSEGTLMPIAMVSGATTTYEDVGLLFNASRTYYIRALIGTSSQPGYYLTEASNEVYGTTSDLTYNVLVQNEYVIDHEVVLTVDLLQGLEQQAFHLTIDDQSNGDRVADTTYTLTNFTSTSLDLLEKKMVLNGSGNLGAYVTIPSHMAEDWTFEMYMKKEIEFPAESQRLLLSGTDFELVMTEEDVDGNSQSTTLALYQNGTEQVRSEVTLPTAAWTHIAVVKAGNQMSVYQGGHLVFSQIMSSDPGVIAYLGKGDGTFGNVEQLSLAFARLWETARSNDQIVTDMLNIYQGTDYPAKLMDQWQFDQLGIDPVPGLKNTLELDLDSSDPGNSPVQWSDMFSITSYEKTVYYRQHVEPSSTHDYVLRLYETGTGEELISKSSTNISASTLPVSQLYLQNTPAITRLRLKTSVAAEQTKATRTIVSSGQEISLGSLGTDHYQSNYWTLDGTNCVYSGTNGSGNLMYYGGGSYYTGSDYSFVIRFKQTEANGEVQYLVNNWKYSHGVVNLLISADNELQLRIQTWSTVLYDLGHVAPDVWHEVLLTYEDLSDGSTIKDGTLTAYFDRELTATHSYANYPHRAMLAVRAIGANTIDSGGANNHINNRKEEFIGEIAYFGGIGQSFDESEIPLSNDLPGRYDGWEMHYLLEDAFDLADENTITGGLAYDYALAPYYEETQFEGTAVTTTVNTTDLTLVASAGTDAITLTWDDAAVSNSFGTDTVYVLRDGEKIARLVGADTYDDTNPAPGTTHTYGVAPVVNGEMAFVHYTEAAVAANGSVNGWLLSKKSDFVLEDLDTEASATIDGQTYSLTLLSDGNEGMFTASGVYYDREATYTFAEPAEATFTLSQHTNAAEKLFVPYDSIAAQVATDEDVFPDFQNADDLGVNNINILSWSTQEFWNGARVYTNVYRNEELIDIVVDDSGVSGNLTIYSDLTGTSGEQYAYKLRSYCHGCIETDITTYKDTLIAMTYPDMLSVANLTATVTTGEVSESDLIELAFTYPFEAIESFDIYRQSDDFDDPVKITSSLPGHLALPGHLVWMTMDGHFDDVSENGNLFTFSSSSSTNASYSTESIGGTSSIIFDGSTILRNEYQSGYFPTTFEERSWSFWIKPSEVSGQHIVYNSGIHTFGSTFRINDGVMELGTISSGTLYVVSGGSITADQWHHVAGVFDQGLLQLYVDGTKVDEMNLGVTSVTSHNVNWQPSLGGAKWNSAFSSTGTSGSKFEGLIDEFYIFETALDAELVQNLEGTFRNYQFVDSTGIPETNYKYWVEANIGNNTSKSNVVEIQYPVVDYRPTNNSMVLSNETTSFGTLVQVASSTDVSATQNFDGLALLADGEVVQTIDIADLTTDGSSSPYKYYMKHYADQYSKAIDYSYAKYKQNEEGLFFFDEVDFLVDRYFDAGFGPLNGTALPQKNIGTVVTGPGFYKVIWDVSGTAWEEGAVEYRVAIDNGSGTPDDVNPLIHSAAGEALADGSGYIYDYDVSDTELQSQSFNISNSANTGVTGFQAIENLQASNDLSEGVFLTWEYPDFADAEFEVFRDNVLLTTVSAGTYHYYDQDVVNINANEVYAYQVRAVYDEDGDGANEWYSARATDAGMRRVRFVVKGHVYDTEGNGLANAGINIRNAWVRTDGSGYYELDQLYYSDGDMVDLTLSVFDPSTLDDDTQSITLTLAEDSPEITQNFVVSNKSFDFEDQLEVAGAVALAAYPDENEFGVRLKVQLSNTNFDGVEIYRSFKLIADLSSYEDLNYVDTNGESGLDYEYTALPYKINTTGTRDYGFGAKEEAVYPPLLAPGYLVSELENGFVNLRFVDKNEGRSYIITRIGSSESEELDEVQVGEVTDGTGEYLDESGVAINTYLYKVYSALEQDEFTATSDDYNFVSASFPVPHDVENLAGVTDESANMVTLTWEIPEDADLVSLNLYENDKLIAIDEELPVSYIDSTGTPGVINTYRLETFRSSSDVVSSTGQSISVRYPDLPSVADLVFNNDASTMTTTISWDYQVKTVDGFYLTITRVATSEVIKNNEIIEAVPGITSYEYLFDDGLSGVLYDYQIVPFTTREGTEYLADTYNESNDFAVLPAVTSVKSVEYSCSAWFITWDYPDRDFSHWSLTLKNSNEIVIDTTVTSGERSILFKKDVGFGLGNWFVTIQAMGDEQDGQDSDISQTFIGSTLIACGEVSLIDASDTEIGYITVKVTNKDVNSNAITLYREGTRLGTWGSGSLSMNGVVTYTDQDIVPGKRYNYWIYQRNSTYLKDAGDAGDQGTALGMDGHIQGSIKTTSGTGVAGVELELTGFFDGRYIKDTTTTWTDGSYAFSELPYSSDDEARTIYTIAPITSDRVFDPERVEVALSKSFNSGSAEIIYDKSSFIVSGMLQYSWTNALVPDLQVTLYGFDDEGNREKLQFQETAGSAYSFAQNIDSKYAYYTVKLDTDYHKDGDEQLYYYAYFADDENGEVISDPILTSDLSPGSEITYSFEDQLTVPTTFSVSGLMGSLGDYKWHIRLQDESRQIDTLLVTDETGVLTVDLPPLNYSARVVAVDRNTAASEAILTYFKAEVIQLSHQDSLKAYTDGYSDDLELTESEYIDAISETSDVFVEEANFIFHKVPRITIRSGFENYINTTCSEGDDLYNIPLLAEDEDELFLTFDVQEEFAGQYGDVTEGHLLIINNTLSGDERTVKLEYDEATGWSADGFIPVNVNVVSPYKQLIEFHYFNENGRYMATATQEVIVTGIRFLGDSDFVTDPDTEVNFPLFVLRDPPGDASKSTIEAGSSVKYSYTSKMALSGSQSIKKEFGHSFFGLGSNFELSVGLDESSTSSDSYSFSLDFKESLSTSGGATFDPDRRAYQLSRESDIIVGMGVNLTYSAAREIDIDDDDQCMIDEDMVITVDLANITTTWNYTVSEIERNIDYYTNLLSDEDVSFENKDEEDDTDIGKKFKSIKQNWQQIIDWHDTQNRAPANMCRLIAVVDDEYNKNINLSTSSDGARLNLWIDNNNLEDELEEVKTFCDDNLTSEDEGNYSVDFSTWDDDLYSKYGDRANEFKDIWLTYEAWKFHKEAGVLDMRAAFVDQFDLETLHSLGSADGFNMVENRSFSSGASYTQTFTSSKSITESLEENLKTSLGMDITSSFKTTTALATWGTLAAPGGIGVITKAPEFKTNVKYKAGLKFVAAFNFSQSATEGESLKISYTLNDNDPGDHFNTWVLHDPTGYKYNTTPDFILTAGKSSCPYEEETIPRDMPQVKAMDEDGVQYPTHYFDLRPFQGSYPVPLQITNLAPFYETRKWGIMQGAIGNVQGLKMVYGQEIIGESASKRLYVQGDEPTYGQLGFGSYGAGLGYDFEDVHVIVGPQCEIANGWVHPETTDTLTFNIHFRRPLPPVGFEQEDNWFITQNVPSWTFGIQNYRLDIRQADFKELWLEYRRTDADNYSWTKMTDEDGESLLSKEFLQSYYDEYRNIYPYEYYPFVWTPDANILDGNYMMRAVIVHPDGEVGYSPTFPQGNIDRRAPRVVNLPQPTDKILSRGDVIGASMDETLNCDFFYAHPELTSLVVYELDSAEYRTLTFHSDPEISEYELRCSGSGIDIIIDEEILGEVDGKDIEFTITGLKDLVGNVADDVVWRFRSDHYKFPVSPIKLYDPSVVLVNKASGSEIPFVMAAMELYENYSVLDSVELQYRKVGTDTYLTYDALTIDEMRSSYELYSPDHTKKPQDTIMLVTAHIPDGQYNFRLVAWGDGRLRTSNGINATFDRINPFVMNVAPDSRVVDWGDQIRVTYSETMYDRDGLSFSAAIVRDDGSSTDFTDRMQGFINSNWTGFTFNDIDDALLHASFGDTLKIELLGVEDYYGNPLEVNVVTFVIGNFAPNVSGVVLHEPQEWVMNAGDESTTFMAGDFDLYGTKGKDLDSLKLVYNLDGTGEYVEIASYTLSELQAIHAGGSNHGHGEPTVNITWDISGEATLADGEYDIYAVAYGDNGKPNYSGSSSGTIDRTAPVYIGAYEPADGLVEATDYFMEFNFTEPVDEQTGTITVSEIVSGVPVAINESLYELYVSGNKLQVMPSESFRVIYKGGTVEVHVDGIEDLNGNALADEFWQQFTMDANYAPPSGSRQLTDLDAERIETGEVAVSWTSYEFFDETMLERSRDGINFTEIARYNGDIDSHMDEVNFSKLVFYRLKQTVDTTTYYSRTVAVETDNLIPLLVTYTYPMPFDGTAFKLSVLTNNLEDDVEFQIMNTTGKVIAIQSINAEKLNNLNVKIRFDEPLKPGIYHMQMVQGQKRSYQKLLVAY